MVDIYRSDDETAEVIKKWWQENGRAVIMGVVIGLAVVVGVRYWFQYQKTSAHNASILYSKMEHALSNNDMTSAMETGDTLVKDYGRTTYAVMASLIMAKVAVDDGKTGIAMNKLQWALDHSSDAMQHTARIRLARLLLNNDQVQQAADLIEGIKSEGYAAAYDELRADIALAKGNKAQAHELYRLAFLNSSGLQREFLQMKMNSTAVDNAAVDSQ